MQKKKSRKIIILVVVGLIILAALSITIAVLAGRKVNEKKYVAKMESAKQYLLEDDYGMAEIIYLQSIQMNPEKTDAYKELIGLYVQEEEYEEAYNTADEGYSHTKDTYFETVMEKVREMQEKKKRDGQPQVDIGQEIFYQEDAEKLAVRFNLLDSVSAFCYQQYVNIYGSCEVKTAGDAGYEAKFANFSGSVYFKNTKERPDLVDTASRKIKEGAKPYKIVLSSPTMLFVGYEDYISYEKIQSIFDIQTEIKTDGEGKYWLAFEKNGCSITMETDQDGNVSGKKPSITLAPLDLKTVDWKEEPEEEPEEEEEGTFTLAGNTYTYDVTEIAIQYETIEDITPLEKCKKLRSLILIGCGIEDITPLRGCDSLVELVLDENPFSDLTPLAGLKNLEYLQFHESGVSDLTPIYDLDLKVMNPCSDGITLEQVEEYKRRHPDCVCYWDYYTID